MLKQLRSGSKSFFVKGLLILVAISFVLWGVGDMFRTNSARSIATVGDVSIPFENYNDALQRQISRYSQLFGKQLGESEIVALGLRQQVASQMVQEELLSQRARDLELAVGKEVVYQRIAGTPLFNDDAGKFDKQKFIQVLRDNGLTETRYVDALSNDMALGFLVSAFVEAEPFVSTLSNELYQANNETRIADLLIIPTTQVKGVPQPSDADLNEFYHDNEAKFTVPEARDISYLLVTPKIVEGELNFSDEQLKEQFEANKEQYETPETRKVSQYLFDTKAEAEEVFDTLQDKESIKVELAELGDVTRGVLPAAIAESVFSLEKGEYSQPTESDLGWHIFTVTNIKESSMPAFNDVKADISKQLRDQQGEELFYSSVSSIEDDIAGGMGFNALAEKYSLEVNEVSKVKASSASLGKLKKANSLVEQGFAFSVGEVSSLIPLDTGEGYAVIKVNKIYEERLQPLDSVKSELVDSWKAKKKQELLHAMAVEFAEQVKKGAEISKLASVPGLRFLPQRSFSKSDVDSESEYPASFVKSLFSIKPDETTTAHKTADGGYIIGRLEQVLEADKAREEDAEGHAAVEQEIKENFNNELMDAYLAYLGTVYKVEINHEVIAPGSE